jgi:succinate dehydrogenase / fumarate reductase flavoprotein subunit
MANEIVQNRGCGENKAFLYLSLAHIDKEILINKLPGVIEVAKNFARVDIFKDPIPVTPSAHYVMGGVPTDINCMVIDLVSDEGQDKVVEGLMCIGEAASISVHGANRLGCNSLLDIIVFGKLAGINAAKILKNQDLIADRKMITKISEIKINRIAAIFLEQKSVTNPEFITLAALKNNLKQINEVHLGVFRSNDLITKALEQINQLFSQFKNYKIANKSLIYNEDLINYLEIENLFLNSYATIYSALQRKESRGAHFRNDYNFRDDQNWRCHSLVSIDNLDDGFLPKLNFSTRKIRNQTKLSELDINPRPRNY